MSQKKITSFFKQPFETNPTLLTNKRKRTDSENVMPVFPSKRPAPASSVLNRMKEIEKDNTAFSSTIGPYWFQELEKEFSEPYFKKLGEFLKKEMSLFTVYPPAKDVYFWTKLVDIYDIKVVILGQDPYIRPRQAHGLAFSVPKGVDIPKSLVNIYAELAKDVPSFIPPSHGCLNGWAMQGVLLLNTCLTVRAGHSDSHKGKGWEKFTDAVINWINQNLSHVVFILWGNNAKEKAKFITKDKHLVLTAAHPSPLSAHRGFFGCGHFSKANEYLKKHNKDTIDWKYLP